MAENGCKLYASESLAKNKIIFNILINDLQLIRAILHLAQKTRLKIKILMKMFSLLYPKKIIDIENMIIFTIDIVNTSNKSILLCYIIIIL